MRSPDATAMRRGPVYAAVGVAQETVFPLDDPDGDSPRFGGPSGDGFGGGGAGGGGGLVRKGWANASFDSLPSSAALDDGLDPQRSASLEKCALLMAFPSSSLPLSPSVRHQDFRRALVFYEE